MLKLPNKITVVDVSPRDGLQSFPRPVDTDTKVAMIDRLSATGLPVIEVTGFAHPRVIPNLADAEAVCDRIKRRPVHDVHSVDARSGSVPSAVVDSQPPDLKKTFVTPSRGGEVLQDFNLGDHAREPLVHARRIPHEGCAGKPHGRAAGGCVDNAEGPVL